MYNSTCLVLCGQQLLWHLNREILSLGGHQISACRSLGSITCRRKYITLFLCTELTKETDGDLCDCDIVPAISYIYIIIIMKVLNWTCLAVLTIGFLPQKMLNLLNTSSKCVHFLKPLLSRI